MSEPTKLLLVFLVVAVVGLLALAVEWFRDRVSGWLWLILVSVVLLLFALWIHPVRAHDHNRPDLDPWYSTLRSGKGLCCGGPKVDAVTLDGPQWKIVGGKSGKPHYEVFLENEWHVVEADAVLTEPNQDGRALVWPTKGWGGLTIRCFMPGSLT